MFEQQPRESDKAFAAFRTYLELGPERSLALAAEKLGKSKTMMEKWSRKFDWAARVQAHSAHLAVVEREAAEALRVSKAADWEAREQQLRETEWAMHERAIAAAKRGLDAYMNREKVYANLADIARMLEIASKLGRLATGLGTDGDKGKGDEAPTVRLEVTVALNKIYGGDEGQAEPARQCASRDVEKVIDVEEAKELRKADCGLRIEGKGDDQSQMAEGAKETNGEHLTLGPSPQSGEGKRP